MPVYPPIADYAVIGDGRTAALVSRDAAIEWLCLPHFSTPSVFAAILDRERGGIFSLSPDSLHSSSRRYVAHTNVLETTLRGAERCRTQHRFHADASECASA